MWFFCTVLHGQVTIMLQDRIRSPVCVYVIHIVICNWRYMENTSQAAYSYFICCSPDILFGPRLQLAQFHFLISLCVGGPFSCIYSIWCFDKVSEDQFIYSVCVSISYVSINTGRVCCLLIVKNITNIGNCPRIFGKYAYHCIYAESRCSMKLCIL